MPRAELSAGHWASNMSRSPRPAESYPAASAECGGCCQLAPAIGSRPAVAAVDLAAAAAAAAAVAAVAGVVAATPRGFRHPRLAKQPPPCVKQPWPPW